MNNEEKSPILEAYGITHEEAKEVEKIVAELAKALKTRSGTIRELKRLLKGNKLLYAIGYLEFAVGFHEGVNHAKTIELIVDLADRLYQ